MASKPLGDKIRAYLADVGGATPRVIAARVGATEAAVRRYLDEQKDARCNAAGAWRIVDPDEARGPLERAEMWAHATSRRANLVDAACATALVEASLRELVIAREHASRYLPEAHALRSAFASVESSLAALVAFTRETERRVP